MKSKKNSPAGLACAALAFLVVVLFSAPSRAADCVPAPTGIVNWWKAEGNANDSVGGSNGVLKNGAGFSAGEAGQAFTFNGAQQYIQIPKAPNQDVGNQVTIEFWMKADPANAMNSYQGLVTSDFFGIEIANGYALGPLGVNFFISTDGGASVLPSSYPDTATVNGGGAVVSAGQWHHVAGTYDGTKLQLYIDGQPWGNPNYHTGAISPMLANSFLSLGGEDGRTICPGCISQRYFNGQIDEATIYNRALSAAEVLSLYNSGSAGKCPPTNSTNNCLTPPTGLVSWWPGEGNAHDAIGGNNATLQGGATFAPGKVGQGFRFDGTNGFAQIPDSAALKPANVTCEAWVWLDPNVPANRGGEQIIFKKNTWSAWFEGYSLLKVTIDNGNGTYSERFQFCVSRTGNQVIINSLTLAQRGVWYHVAGTYDGNQSKLYINGVAEASAVAGFALDYGTDPIFIGTSGTWAPYLSMFAGIIDEPSIYNRALSQTELAAIYNAGTMGKCTPTNSTGNCLTPPSGLVSWWQAESNAVDRVSGNNGALTGGTGFTGGEVGQAFNFNGTSSYVTVPDSASLQLTNELTIECWIKRQQLTDDYLVNKGGDWSEGALNYGFAIAGPGNGNVLHFLYANGIRGTVSITDFNWHHCAVTAHNGDADATFYVDGVQQPILLRKGPATINLPASTKPLLIGAQIAPIANYFSAALIDELSLYNRVLSQSEIQSIYTAGSAGKCASTSLSGVPVITSVLPGVGAVSNVITISGNNFSPNPAGNLVRFGAVQAAVLSASATQLTVAVPPGATFAPITVTVNGLVAFANQPFEPTFSGTGAAITTSSFAPSFNLPTGSNPACVVVADFDGDGKPDLAQVNYDGHTVSLYRNLSTGGALSAASFAARVDLPLPAGANGGNAYRLRAVDLDGDGKLDLIVGEAAGSRVVIFRNIAAPGSLTTSSFEAPVSISAGNDARFATAADLDGDGRAELISLNYADNTISIFKNIGTGGSLSSNSFAAPVNLGSAAGPYELAVGDLDGDGKPDLAVVNASANVISVFRNTTTPGMIDASSFAPRVDFPSQNFGDTIAIGDLDGDGKSDLVVGFYLPSTISVYRNLSTPGSFTTTSLAAPVDFALPGRGHTVALADFNGDGKPDITVVGELPDYMSVFKNVSTPGSFTPASLAPRVDFGTGWNAWGVAAGDLNGDGRPDVVLVNQYDSTMTIYQNLSPFGGTPFITTQPADQTVTTGNTASFSVLAGGDTQLTYQWRFNDTNISGATNTSLTLFNVQSNQAGSYSFVVSNSFGSLTSSNALLTVNPAVCLTPPSGLVGWWSAESNVLDNVSGNNGTLAGGASFAPGKIGQGFRFDGVNGYVQIPDSALLKPAHVTVEAWVWLDPNVNTGPTTECIIFKRNSWTYLFEGYNLAKSSLDTGNGTYSDRFFFVITRNGNQVIINSTTVAQRGVWYHVAATYDGNQATLFVNGVAEASAAPGFALDYGDRPIFIGTSGEPAPYTSMFAGIIDEPSIYARALSTNEIAALYNAGGADKCNVPVAPTIVVQPQDTAAPFGGTAMFNVAAGGTLPLSYQWFVNSNALHDETNSSLTLNSLTLSQSGNLYSVTITNTGGFTLSSNAVLTVINTPPQISNPGSHIVSYLAPPQSLAFTVSDAESPASSLQVTVSSSNTNLVPNEQIILSGTDTNRTITLTPSTNLLGNTTITNTTITLTVVDPGGLSNQTSFVFTVINNTPKVSSIASFHTPANVPTAPIAFTISDVETPADQLILSASSSNTNVVSTNQIIFGGSSSNRTVTITPTGIGATLIVIKATDALGVVGATGFTLTVDQFTQLTNNLPSLSFSTATWGDYDNDGKLDLLVTGTTNGISNGAVTRIYHNDGGVFTNFISLTGVFKSAAAWGDYDRDGFLDVLISGLTSSNLPITRVYHNNGNGTFTDINAGLTACYSGTVAWGDFNNDGALDIFLSGLVTTTNGTSAVTTNIVRLYRNDGGTFTDMNLNLTTTDNRTAGPNNGTAAWGDYDNDGRLDLLLVGSLNNLTGIASIYRNLGNGTFSNVFSSSSASSITAGDSGAWGDYDNDGWLDFAIGSSRIGTVIYHNNRNGTFSQTASLPSFTSVTTPSVAWGDFDNDGNLDLLIGSGSTSRVFRNNGNASFTDITATLPTSVNGAVAWGDYDNDGDLDMAFVGSKTTLVRNNNGAPNTPPAAPANLASAVTLSNSVIFAWSRPLDSQTYSNGLNYNLRIGTTPGGIEVISPQADAVTGLRRIVAMGNVGPTNRALVFNLPKGNYYWSVQAIDTAFAGSPFASEQTFAITNARPAISDIADQIVPPNTNAPGPVIPFVIGDLETGASNLVVTARSSNTNVVALTGIVFGGAGSNRTIRVTARTNGISIITVTVTDAQGAFASANFTVRAEQFTLLSTNFVQVENSAVAWGDIDNDGDLDLVIAGNTNGLPTGVPSVAMRPVTRLYRNDGNGAFVNLPVNFPGVSFGSLAWGDYNNDGKLDLLITGTTNNEASGAIARVYRNNGDGTFTDINAGLPGVYYSAVAWGDYDNDGRPDILITGTTNGTGSGTIARLYRNNGDGTFSNAVTFPGIYQGAVAFADFDGDGDLDLVMAGINVNVLSSVYRNNGTNTFTLMTTSIVPVYNCSLAVGDADNDGRPDILLSGYSSTYYTYLYRNTGNFGFTPFTVESIQGQGARYASAALGDFDNDGRLDVLLSGTSNGQSSGAFTRVYRNTGSFISQGIPSFTLVPTTLPTNYFGAVAWADFDNDGDLDILVTGSDGVGIPNSSFARAQTMLFRNNNGIANTPPTAPTTLSAVRSNNFVALTWAKSTDAQTRTTSPPQLPSSTNYSGLKYQLRVGTTPGGLDTESPLADLSNGYHRVVRVGDASTNRWRLSNLPPGNYYWSVQAIDTAFAGSPFATESTFTVLTPPVAMPDTFSTPTNTPVTFSAFKLTLNDLETNGYPLSVTAVSTTSAMGGTVSLTAGQLTYRPPTDFSGNDTFTYTLSDGQSAPVTGTVTATVGNGGLISLNIVSGPLVDGADFVVRFAGIPGFTYTIEAANNLSGPWIKVSNLAAPTTDTGFGVGVFEFREPMNGNSTRFYRTIYPAY